jgi:hypothetical protein
VNAASGSIVGNGGTEAVMLSIAQANIDRYKLLLETETDPTKRAMIIRLLAEEQEKLKDSERRRAREA